MRSVDANAQQVEAEQCAGGITPLDTSTNLQSNPTPSTRQHLDQDFQEALTPGFETAKSDSSLLQQDPLEYALKLARQIHSLTSAISGGDVSPETIAELRTLQSEWDKEDGVFATLQSAINDGSLTMTAEARRDLIRMLHAGALTDHLEAFDPKDPLPGKVLGNLVIAAQALYAEGLWKKFDTITHALYNESSRKSFDDERGVSYEDIKALRDNTPGLSEIFADMLGRDLNTEIALQNPAYQDYLHRELSPELTAEVRMMTEEVRSGKLEMSAVTRFQEEARRLAHEGALALEYESNPPKTSSERESLASRTVERIHATLAERLARTSSTVSVANFKEQLQRDLEVIARGMEKRGRYSPDQIASYRKEARDLLKSNKIEQEFPEGIPRDQIDAQLFEWSSYVRDRAFP